MTEAGSVGDRRAQNVAIVGFLLQLAAFGTLLGLALWSKSDAIMAAARWIVPGLPIWVILFLVFKQLRRVSAEELETAELKRAREAGASDSIFEVDDEALLLERNRLRWLVKWLLSTTTVAAAAVLLIGHFLFWNWSLDAAFSAEGGIRRAENPTLVMWFVVGLGFLCFLYARYAVALSRMPSWRLLRAGATFTAGNALVCLGLAIALGAGTNIAWAEPLLAYIIRAAMVLLGIELTGNFILDFYRPRTPGIIPRPSFDSRLLGLIGEPGGIAKSIADAINYQFGFEVSKTWFYQLLQQWLFPIMVFTSVVVLALTSIVIVDADEAVVIERFGRPVTEPAAVLGPGLHVKWPYPVDVVYRAPVRQMQEMVLGEAARKDDEDPRKAILWTEEHDYVPELMLLVASPKLEKPLESPTIPAAEPQREAGTESVAVSLLMVSVPIEYRIKDMRKFTYKYADPIALMEGVAYQYLSDFAASVDIDRLMGPDRTTFNDEFKNQLQKRLDELDVGIEVVFSGVRGAHPPAAEQVAATFLAVVKAQTDKAATINAADGEARKTLISVAGTEASATALNEAIVARDKLRGESGVDPQKLAEAEQLATDLMLGNPDKGITPLSGQAAAVLAEARGNATIQIAEASRKLQLFSTDVVAYSAAPELFKQRRLLEVYAGLQSVRKYLIVGDPSNVIIEYETSQQGGLDRVLSEGQESQGR
jgi:regulator of protease activity HflC (stomatin/prohibitin superfamily)